MKTRVRNWLALTAGVSAAALGAGRLLQSNEASATTQQEKSAPQRDPAPAPGEKAEMTVLLLGDAGAPATDHEPVLTALQKAASEDPKHTMIVFMGDNIYPDGMPDSSSPSRKEAERRLNAQMDVVKDSKAHGIFISGNHDWGGITGRDGWNSIRREAAYIASKNSGAVMMPEGGCPGPAVADIGNTLRLVMLDTQWWLRRVGPPKSAKDVVPCAFVSQKSVLDSLKFLLRNTGGRRVVLMSHHPLASQGQHGGYFTSDQQMFPLTSLKSWLRIPLPMVGSVYVAARRLGMSEQDLGSQPYTRMIQQIMSTFSDEEPLIYAAGHDHEMQVLGFGGAPRYVLVAGSGIYGHVSGVQSGGAAKMAKAESGFMRLRTFADGRIHLSVFTVDHGAQTTEAFEEWVTDPKGSTKPLEKPRAD